MGEKYRKFPGINDLTFRYFFKRREISQHFDTKKAKIGRHSRKLQLLENGILQQKSGIFSIEL